jgi:TolB-like protein
MRIAGIYKQLKDRRVIRAAVIYVALLWAVLQAADLFAGADIISETTVRWLIMGGVAGLPMVVLASWFFESPWRERRWTAVAGDLVVIVALLFAAALFAWQQWFVAFTRPTIAVRPIEATDTRVETRDLADHLTRQLRLLLASRPELRVIELDSSMHPSLDGISVSEQAEALTADYVLAGTLSGQGQNLRWSVQLFAGEGELIWSDGFEGPLLYQEQLQGWVLEALWPQLPLNPEALEETRELLASCGYPADAVAILTLARVGRRGGDSATLAMVAASHEDAGLLHIAKARFYFDQVRGLPPTQRPVTQSLGMQSLEIAARTCAEYPEIELLRLVNTRELNLQNGAGVAALYLAFAELQKEAGATRKVTALVEEALLLDPLGAATQCRVQELLESSDAGDCS